MIKDIIIREVQSGEEEPIYQLIKETFYQYNASHHTNYGINQFLKFINPTQIKRRLRGRNFSLIALNQDKIVGVIEIRKPNHITLFFVDGDYQGNKIGKKLTELAINKCRSLNPKINAITVNSSVYAVEIYKRLGFKETGKKQLKNGMVITPMKLKIHKKT